MARIDQAISERGAAYVYSEIDFEPGCVERMAALGLDGPQTLGDVRRASDRAYRALSRQERQIADACYTAHHSVRCRMLQRAAK
jgi:hypothetical protein